MNVRCKFRCVAVNEHEQAGGESNYTVLLEAVTGGSEENERFWRFTPSGRLDFQCLSEAVAAEFVPGSEYFLDISAASDP